jgi:Zn-dependent protease with chaperone function
MVQAQAGGSPSDYQFIIYGGIDRFPEKQQEAVLHHEAGHVKHHDSLSTMVQMFAVTLGPTLAMLSGAAHEPTADYLGAAALPMLWAAVPLWYKNKKRDEYHADQHAAHVMGSPEQLVRFFVESAETDAEREAALLAAEGKPYTVKPVGWKAKALAAWRALRLLVSSHPTHEQRIQRLRALSVPVGPAGR